MLKMTQIRCFWCRIRAEKTQLQGTQVYNKTHQKRKQTLLKIHLVHEKVPLSPLASSPIPSVSFSGPSSFREFWPSVVLSLELFLPSIILLQMIDGEVTGLTVPVLQAHTHIDHCVVVNPLRANYCHTLHMENHLSTKANPSCTTDSSMYGGLKQVDAW